jgi:hypothetical protein
MLKVIFNITGQSTVNISDLSVLAANWGWQAPTTSWSCTSNLPVDDAGSWTYLEDDSCTFPEDSTNFVGMNNPNMANGLGYLIDQNVWSPFCTEANGTIDPNGVNDSACVNRQSQELQANNAQDYVITSNAPTNGNGNVTSYPDVGTYAYTGVLDDYTSLTSTYNLTMPVNSNTIAWATHDDWLSEPGTPDGSFTYEVQFHYDSSITSSYYCSPTWSQGNWGTVASDVMIGGAAWTVCDGQAAHNTNGSCPSSGCGEIVFEMGSTGSDPTELTSTSGTLNLKAMFQWLEDNDVPGKTYPFMQPGSALSAISSGWEIVSTGGTTEQFVNNGFTIDAVGAPSVPSEHPSGITFTPSGSSCDLSWSADSSATRGYDIYWYGGGGGGGGGGVWIPTGTTTYDVTATAGTTVYAELASSSNGGQGPWSSYANCTVP